MDIIGDPDKNEYLLALYAGECQNSQFRHIFVKNASRRGIIL